PEAGISRSILLCCTTQRRDNFCRNANGPRLSRPMMWNKLVFAERDIIEDLPGLPDQSALTPANFTTLPHFSVSSTLSLPKSLGEPVSAVPSRSASRAFILGSATPASISLLSLSMISTGVFLGAPTPYQPLAS